MPDFAKAKIIIILYSCCLETEYRFIRSIRKYSLTREPWVKRAFIPEWRRPNTHSSCRDWRHFFGFRFSPTHERYGKIDFPFLGSSTGLGLGPVRFIRGVFRNAFGSSRDDGGVSVPMPTRGRSRWRRADVPAVVVVVRDVSLLWNPTNLAGKRRRAVRPRSRTGFIEN